MVEGTVGWLWRLRRRIWWWVEELVDMVGMAAMEVAITERTVVGV